MARPLSKDDYTVGWICPLEVELVAALEMLDETHPRLSQPHTDHNAYTLGSIAGYNIVIASLPGTGNASAATVVAHMARTFQNVRYALLVGIGGGVPTTTDNGHIRLGHVVVSKPTGTLSGAVQYDHGKAQAGQFERTGVIPPPPNVLLSAAQRLAAERARLSDDPVQSNVKRINTAIHGLRRYTRPKQEHDALYAATYIHQTSAVPCDECGCDPTQRVNRAREDGEPDIVVHRGTIASGGLVVRDAVQRDGLAAASGALCFETEAAGALNDFSCLVIRGISDYCDSHKNDQWHGYAAAAAAAYARQLFFHMPILDDARDGL